MSVLDAIGEAPKKEESGASHMFAMFSYQSRIFGVARWFGADNHSGVKKNTWYLDFVVISRSTADP